MKRGIRQFVRGLVLGVLYVPLLACGSSGPQAPTPPPPASLTVRIQGVTRDEAWRPVAGVTIEAVAGAMAGPSVLSQENGAFTIEVTGVTGEVVVLRATKEGYAPATTRHTIMSSGNVTVYISLHGPDVVAPGEYTVTMVSDCPDFPGDLRTRSYSTTMTILGDILSVSLKGPFVVWGEFGLVVLGRFVYLDIDSGVYEALPDHTYWRFTAFAEGVVDAPIDGRTVVPFSGVVEYCVLRSAASAGKFCSASPEETLVHRQCRSDTHQLVFDRR